MRSYEFYFWAPESATSKSSKSLTVDVSRVSSISFHHMSQNATFATEFARCHHLTQAWQCDSQKTRNTTRLKCCACHAKWRWRSPKCCACLEKCNSSSENLAKALRLSRRTTFDTLSKCHVCIRNEVTQRLKPPKVTTFAALPRGKAIAISRERLRTDVRRWRDVQRTHPQPPNPRSETWTLATYSGKKRSQGCAFVCAYTTV